MEEDGLSGSEQFMLIAGGITMLGACVGMTYQFILKSRCSKLSFCWKCAECDRQVVDLTAADTELGNIRPTFTSAT